MTFEIEIGGRTRTVAIEPVGVPVAGGGRFRLTVQGGADGAGNPHSFEVDARTTDLGFSMLSPEDGRVSEAAVTPRPGGVWLVQLPHVDIEAIVDARRRLDDQTAGASADGEHRVTAPMPGRVLRVLVQPGDEVTVRQGLVVVEAMKMENELIAPRAGRIREVHVAAGASVEAGRVLVVLE
jgi:acetyl/propionyl-CoA carboxylase alpha subunit